MSRIRLLLLLRGSETLRNPGARTRDAIGSVGAAGRRLNHSISSTADRSKESLASSPSLSRGIGPVSDKKHLSRSISSVQQLVG